MATASSTAAQGKKGRAAPAEPVADAPIAAKRPTTRAGRVATTAPVAAGPEAPAEAPAARRGPWKPSREVVEDRGAHLMDRLRDPGTLKALGMLYEAPAKLADFRKLADWESGEAAGTAVDTLRRTAMVHEGEDGRLECTPHGRTMWEAIRRVTGG